MKACDLASLTVFHLMIGRRTAWRYLQDQPNSRPWSDGKESGLTVLASSEWAFRHVSVIKRMTLRIASLFKDMFLLPDIAFGRS